MRRISVSQILILGILIFSSVSEASGEGNLETQVSSISLIVQHLISGTANPTSTVGMLGQRQSKVGGKIHVASKIQGIKKAEIALENGKVTAIYMTGVNGLQPRGFMEKLKRQTVSLNPSVYKSAPTTAGGINWIYKVRKGGISCRLFFLIPAGYDLNTYPVDELTIDCYYGQ